MGQILQGQDGGVLMDRISDARKFAGLAGWMERTQSLGYEAMWDADGQIFVLPKRDDPPHEYLSFSGRVIFALWPYPGEPVGVCAFLNRIADIANNNGMDWAWASCVAGTQELERRKAHG